jgi:hypothetical protein
MREKWKKKRSRRLRRKRRKMRARSSASCLAHSTMIVADLDHQNKHPTACSIWFRDGRLHGRGLGWRSHAACPSDISHPITKASNHHLTGSSRTAPATRGRPHFRSRFWRASVLWHGSQQKHCPFLVLFRMTFAMLLRHSMNLELFSLVTYEPAYHCQRSTSKYLNLDGHPPI